MEHIKNIKLKEKKLNLNREIEEEVYSDEEISKDDIKRVMKIQTEILKIFEDNKCSTNEAYVILAAMLESIYTFYTLKQLGYEK